jgi:hypothetical protein
MPFNKFSVFLPVSLNRQSKYVGKQNYLHIRNKHIKVVPEIIQVNLSLETEVESKLLIGTCQIYFEKKS